MNEPIFDFDDGDVATTISEHMAVDSQGNLLMRVSENMALDLNTGEVHTISPWPNDAEDAD